MFSYSFDRHKNPKLSDLKASMSMNLLIKERAQYTKFISSKFWSKISIFKNALNSNKAGDLIKFLEIEGRITIFVELFQIL